MAAKDSETVPAARRSCFFTACTTLFSFIAFLRLLECVPCSRCERETADVTNTNKLGSQQAVHPQLQL